MTAPASYIPDRCDIVWITFDPQRGHEQSGHRPGFIVTPRRYNDLTGLAYICPVTSRVRGYPFEVKLPEAAPVKGVIMVDQMRSLDWRARKPRYECRCEQVISEVVERLMSLIEG